MNSTQLGTAQKAQSVNQIPATAQELKVASKPIVSYSGTQQNELLAALPDAEWARWQQRIETTEHRHR